MNFDFKLTILVIIISRNSWKSILPVPSLSKFPIRFFISSFVGSNPNALNATLSSFASIVPDPLVSKRSNASLISCFYDSDNSYLYGFFFFLAYLASSAAYAPPLAASFS